MQYTLLHQKSKKHYTRYLPIIHKSKHINKITIDKFQSPQRQQKRLLLQLNAIDQTLKIDSQLNNCRFYQGYIFVQHQNIKDNNHIKLVNALENCLKKQNNIIEQGFKVWSMTNNQQQISIVNKHTSIHDKLINTSLKNVQEYESRKIKINKRPRDWVKYYQGKIEQRTKKNSYINNSKLEHIKQMSIEQSRITRLHPARQLMYSKKSTENKRTSSKYYTQHSQTNPEAVSKTDINRMLRKVHKLFSIWIPPASYPQFLGMFSYTLKQIRIYSSNKLSNTPYHQIKPLKSNKPLKCKLIKFFFYRHSLSKRLFQGILTQVSGIEDTYVEILQIVIQKDVFIKFFQPIGWKMKTWEGIGKVRIEYYRNK